MVSLDEIERSILELENNDTTFATCEKLAMLYTVRDHLKPPKTQTGEIDVQEQSEFMKAVNGKNVADVLSVVNEHMEAISVIYPREFNAVVAKIKAL